MNYIQNRNTKMLAIVHQDKHTCLLHRNGRSDYFCGLQTSDLHTRKISEKV